MTPQEHQTTSAQERPLMEQEGRRKVYEESRKVCRMPQTALGMVDECFQKAQKTRNLG